MRTMTRRTVGAAIAAIALGATGCSDGAGPEEESVTPRSTQRDPQVSDGGSGAASPSAAQYGPRALSDHRVSMTVEDQSCTIALYDNPTADSLLDQLPLTVTSDNYPGYDEKLLRLEEGLSMQDAPAGDDPLHPEVGWYEPGGWIALYYGHIGYFDGKVPLGTLDATAEQLRAIPVGASITFTLLQD